MKEVSGRKVELGKVIEPVLEMSSSAELEVVPEQPSPPEEEANDNVHSASNIAATKSRRSTRERIPTTQSGAPKPCPKLHNSKFSRHPRTPSRGGSHHVAR